jgi:hypothetical protein
VVNKFSLNATGGYSAGVDGAEIGLLFNINKKDVQYFQFGGAFNMVGGNVKGLQIGGVFNNVLDSVKGVQISMGYNRIARSVNGFQLGGLANSIKENFNGMQMSMIYNQVDGNFNGFQFGGLLSRTRTDFRGAQISVLGNSTKGISRGIQVAGVFNYAREMRGLHIGLVNVADTASGYTFGLINIIRKGYHKITFSTNETIEVNAAIKTGSQKFYTMLLGGMNTGPANKLYATGFGLGREYRLSDKLLLNPEISSRYVYQGSWQDVNLLNRLDLTLNYRLNKWLAITGGPALNFYYSEQKTRIGNYAFVDKRKSWVGWNLGLTLF